MTHCLLLNIIKIVKLILMTQSISTKLGFVVHPEKSILKPVKEIEFLGFIINSLTMSVRLSASKSAKVQAACRKLLQSEHISIQDAADVVGLLLSSLSAVQYGESYYRKLKIDKKFALRQNQGDFDAPMTLSDNSKSELLWWITNITDSHRSLIQSNPDLVLTTDASLLGWGAVMNEKETGGQ